MQPPVDAHTKDSIVHEGGDRTAKLPPLHDLTSKLQPATPTRSDSMESPSVAISESYPGDLHYVKALFLEKQYRQAITTCREILKGRDAGADAHPVRDTFVRFYLALSHDELARAMHNFSQAKVPAFNQAEHFYKEALEALPTAAECLAFTFSGREELQSEHEPQHDTENHPESEPESSFKPETPSRHDSPHSFATLDQSRPTSMESMPPSPHTHIRNNSLSNESPPASETGAEYDHLESHSSFNDILTPGRLPKLQRDFSSMSLLDPNQMHVPQRQLMRPVRLGSPAKPYQLPLPPIDESTKHLRPALPSLDTDLEESTPTQQPSRILQSSLPRLDTSPQKASPVTKQLLSPSEQGSPVASPVSPLGDADAYFSSTESDATVSPISPDTPWRLSHYSDPDQDARDLHSYQLVTAHLNAMRTQLQSHLRLLQTAKLKTLDAQAERSQAHAVNDRRAKALSLSSNRLSSITNPRASLPSTRSFWSFLPEDVRVVEKQNRIELGRAREWKRERFDPSKYQQLAERALAEL